MAKVQTAPIHPPVQSLKNGEYKSSTKLGRILLQSSECLPFANILATQGAIRDATGIALLVLAPWAGWVGGARAHVQDREMDQGERNGDGYRRQPTGPR